MAKVKDYLEDLIEEAYDLGGKDAYRRKYGRSKKESWTKQIKTVYDEAYIEQPYGQKEYGDG